MFICLYEDAQSCPTLCNPMDCSLPGSSVHEIFQARILEWVAISFSRASSQPRDRIQASHIVGRHYHLSYQGSPLQVKKEFIGPGLHFRPICADHAQLPLQWTLNSLLSVCGNDNGRIRPSLDRGILKIISGLLIA